MSWQLLTAISVITLSVSVLLQRVLLHKDKIDPYAFAVIFQAMAGVILFAFVLVKGFSLPGMSGLLVPAFISVICYGIGHIAYAKTLQKVEASAFSVLFATQTVWIMLVGIWWFHESITALQVVGTLLIFAAVGLLVTNIRSFKIDKGIALGLFTGLLFGIATVTWSYVGRHTDTLSWAALSFILTAFASLMVKPSAGRKIKSLVTGKLVPKLVILSVFYAAGCAALLFAFKEGTFTEVSPVRQAGIVVTTLLALLFLPKERNHVPRKLIAAFVCFAGVLLIIL